MRDQLEQQSGGCNMHQHKKKKQHAPNASTESCTRVAMCPWHNKMDCVPCFDSM